MATTKKATAKKATSKKATARKTSTTKRTAAKKPATTPLLEREPQTLVQDLSYAVAGLSVEAVSLAKSAVSKIDELRSEVTKAAQDPKATFTTVREQGPAKVEKTVADVRGKLITELEDAVRAFEATFDTRATEGRKLIGDLKKDQRVSKFLDQTSNSRSQLKAAFTSVTKTGQVAVDAGIKQADTAGSQVKGAVTSVTKTAEAAVDAARDQASTATTQVKGAVTSVRRSADAASDAAEATAEKVDDAS